jgi:hypothetical protein
VDRRYCLALKEPNMWGQNWGQLVWGKAAAVPVLGWWGALLLGAVLGVLGVRFLRKVPPRTAAWFVMALALLIPLAAAANLPFTFTNGTVADANQVNANFAAVNVTTARIYQETSTVIPPAPGFAFAGPFATLTTTAAQRITGAVTLTLFASQGGNVFSEALCYRQSLGGGALQTFPGGGSIDGLVEPPTANVTEPSTITDTVVPGAGTWDVGPCIGNGTGSVNLTVSRAAGWFQVTPQ